MKPSFSSLDESIKKIARYFNVEFINYGRDGNRVIIASGCGIGVGLMDVIIDARYFIDSDRYRNRMIDWEIIAAMLSLSADNEMILAGWFSFDGSDVFDAIERGFKGKLYRYDGGGCSSLSEFIEVLV